MLFLLACTAGGANDTSKETGVGTDPSDTDTDTDTDADSDSDTDSDTDADTDSDADADSDTDTGDLCDEEVSLATPTQDCVTASISCGETVEATTMGGASTWTGEDYVDWFCFTNLDRHDYGGTEAVFSLDLDETQVANITLTAPCGDLDLAVVDWGDDTCPTSDAGISNCEGGDDDGGDTARVDGFFGRWLIIVDSKDATDANFRLDVACEG